MGKYKRWLEDLSVELLRYGKIRYDLNYEDTDGNCKRLRVFEYQNKMYIHRMLNGDLVELTEI